MVILTRWLLLSLFILLFIFMQVGHPHGTPKTVREFDSGRGKVGKLVKVGEIVVCLWCDMHKIDRK